MRPTWLERAATIADITLVADFLNMCNQHDEGENFTSVEMLTHEWTHPVFDPARDARLLLDADGTLVGYIHLWTRPPFVRNFAFGRVHPAYRGQGIGHRLVDIGEQLAARAVQEAPAEARVALIHTDITSQNQAAADLLRSRGYAHIRTYWRMEISLDQPLPAVQLPEGITLRTARPGGEDDYALYLATEDGFQDHYGFIPMSYENWHSANIAYSHYDPTLYFLAMDGEEIAAVCLCERNIPEDEKMGWISKVAVRRPWRRQGIAEALLYHSFHEFKRRGQARAGLGVDAGSLTGATRLYEKAGMHVAKAYHNFEKALREGVDLSTTGG